MRNLYTIILYLVTPFLLLRLYWRGRQNAGYRQRWYERFGYLASPQKPVDLWLHAVSVGEVIATIPLVKQLQLENPTTRILVTTTTPTGSMRVQQVLGDTVEHVYLPYDLPVAVKRFLKAWQPRLAIIMETELWPNMLHYCGHTNTPVLIANARLSERSARGYAKISSLARAMMSHITLLLAQDKTDAQRFIDLGLDPERVRISGSIKFDISIPTQIIDAGKQLRQKWGKQRPVVVAASTHSGEDEQILAAFNTVRQDFADAVLIIVPRHPERFDKVASLCQQAGFNTVMRTNSEQYSENMDILVGNTMGEMLLFYAAADVAFVAGSLIPHGGHNVLEPAAMSKAIITGPHVFNFTTINALLSEAQAIISVNDAQQLATAVIKLFREQPIRQQMGRSASQVVEKNRGALAQHVQYIRQLGTTTR
ncbi:MAG: lipid IV(A) 3-deoxy-D-manno-octulosonic acid transferase [Gammaproteobacteria bacterium]